jgi:hypothetical protein
VITPNSTTTCLAFACAPSTALGTLKAAFAPFGSFGFASTLVKIFSTHACGCMHASQSTRLRWTSRSSPTLKRMPFSVKGWHMSDSTVSQLCMVLLLWIRRRALGRGIASASFVLLVLYVRSSRKLSFESWVWRGQLDSRFIR